MSRGKEKKRYQWVSLKELSAGSVFTPIKAARGKNTLCEEGKWGI